MPNQAACPVNPIAGAETITGPVLSMLEDALARLRFGVVELTVHDGRIVQLEVTEKHRF